jgi:hypothetical protein
MVRDYLEVFERVISESHRGLFRRPHGILQPPPSEVADVKIFPVELSYRQENTGCFPNQQPDYLQFQEETRGLWDAPMVANQ